MISGGNVVFRILMIMIIKNVGYYSLSKEMSQIKGVVLALSFFNSALLVLLMNAKPPDYIYESILNT